MRRLLIRLLLLTVAAGAGLLALLPVLRNGRVDAFYARFTSPPAGSLIVGTSRAAQGIRPDIITSQAPFAFDGPLLNYAFTLTHSPYGPAYLASIRRKLKPETRNGLFIVAVDPWSLAAVNEQFPEASSFIGQLSQVSQNPNLPYLTRYQTKPLYRLLLDYATATERLHPDGWLEVRIATDSATVRARTARKVLDYRKLMAAQHLSAGRLAALRQTIELLRQHGRVYLVRLPVGPPLRQLEQEFQPDFAAQMQQLARQQQVRYLDYSAQPYATTDGNHLQREAAAAFSRQLAAALR
ncbi:hypothetical protein Q5H93_17025 [Hymenobacter sp. ASUV-10]|uniref:SGNH/GDSL hydrolase family protein n=1 Tax=Hymenobacter aranciens TaxID=3063996 RepID=A0ABT9BDW0_9BACT|nr:hypothetical protein [Hymenobacter sp. ASUV-10]MDO7876450.1 hypothetical protein [Hymenobacter sp. ASUV-10]